MPLPNPSMDFTPFDVLTAAELDDLVENIEALATGSALATSSITPEKLLAGTGTTWPWQAWIPTWANFTIGDGSVDAKFKQIGKTVHYRIHVVGGSTSSSGSLPTFSLPVTSVATPSIVMAIGWGQYINKPLWATWASTTTALMRSWDANNDLQNITATLPATFGNGSVLDIQGFYEVA